jgi:E3 ubiquitin-protein ligase mind-bomb
MRSRRESRRVAVKGIFQHAHIVRGSDWKWGNQDGGIGTHGEVVAIKDWQKESMRSVAEVQWKGKKKTNIYRLGHKGKVDLKCVEPSEGGSYYPDHLPILGI